MYPTAFPKSFVISNEAHNTNCLALVFLCICLYLLSQIANCPPERLGHPVVRYIAVAERPCDGCPVPNWKETGPELTSQLFLVLKLRCIFLDDISAKNISTLVTTTSSGASNSPSPTAAPATTDNLPSQIG